MERFDFGFCNIADCMAIIILNQYFICNFANNGMWSVKHWY